ncbi:MAG: mercuric reductase [Betaproteobacteria bacterium RIFCSPHIGHO2_12_FULL_69_13]|nr:MAG: mercuric reductase [Betaproteobacteria bacterium RIFCSPHIGHO2_12_FULL_69_13]OGA66572.1 MAG: mercuric reductase [Betaproteobacteria bacterium RIFCSPLOWO2_12_FULL_68_20]
MTERFDAIVIGTGQAAPALCARLDREGLKTALIERKLLGGTCVNNGCIPTKTLVASARAARMARRAAEYGVALGGAVRVDMKAVKARKDGVVGQSSEGLASWIGGMKNVTLIRGHARFTAPHAIAVNGRVLEAQKIFINTGARAFAPDLPGLKDVAYRDNVSMMEVDFVPEHLVIVGGSYIGLEFAQMYRRFGSRVTVVERAPRLISREDDDVSDEIRAILEREGVEIRTGAECMRLERRGSRIAVGLECRDGAPLAEGSHLLMAVGRRPNTDDLGLGAAGIATDERGYIEVNDECRTSVEGVWALGDVNGRGAFTHTSYNDYEIVAANLFDGDKRRISDRIQAYALFIDPPLGRAGMTGKEAARSGRRILAGKMPMTRVGRAREAGETQGFMKVLADAGSGELLGAAILGMNGDEIVHSLLDVMYARKPYTTIQRAVHIHPTVTELIPTLLGSLKPL